MGPPLKAQKQKRGFECLFQPPDKQTYIPDRPKNGCGSRSKDWSFMIMKKKHPSFARKTANILCLAAAGFWPASRGAVEIARGELALETEWSCVYDSNIFTNSSEQEDFLGRFTPTLRYKRAAGRVQAKADIGVEIGRFADFDGNDYEDIKAGIEASFPHRLDRNHFNRFQADYNQTSEANPDVGTRTERHEWSVSDDFRCEFSDKFGLRLLPVYFKSEARSRGLFDRGEITAGARLLYIYSSKLDLELGLRYRATEVEEEGLDTEDFAILAGATGRIFPKVTGAIAAGAQNRSFDDPRLNDEASPYVSLELVWDSQHKTTVTLLMERDFDTTDNSLSLSETRAGLDAACNFTEYFQGAMGAYAARADYTARRGAGQTPDDSREDDIYGARASLLYEIGDRAEITCRARYENRDSSFAATDYEKFTFEISAKILF